MDRQTFAGDGSTNRLPNPYPWTEKLIVITLLLAGLLLFTINLGNLPLRDWNEGTIAQVAREIINAPENSDRWLFPTLWGEPYLEQLPLVHNLIALFYRLFGINETAARLPIALLMTISVPLFYGVGRELFIIRQPALLSTLVYLTSLPLVRNGRFAMLGGALIAFQVLLLWSLLRSRRDLRWCLGIGLSLSLISLTQGIIAVLLASIAFGFLAWDTPRLLRSFYFWGGIFIGCLPAIACYGIHWFHYQDQLLDTEILFQSFQPIWESVGDSNRPWYHWLHLLQFLPWLIFTIAGLRFAWEEQLWGWAKLTLVGSGFYFVFVFVMSARLPWYILPLYPFLALITGAILNEVLRYPQEYNYPRHWGFLLLLLGLGAIGISIYYALEEQTSYELILIFLTVGLTTGISGSLILKRDSQFISMLVWGTYLSLLFLVSSPHWIWELNEAYPVQPVAMLIRDYVPDQAPIYTSYPEERPSLNFYAQREVIPASTEELKFYAEQSKNTYLLVDTETLEELDFIDHDWQHHQAPPNWNLLTPSTLE
ncbi:glycosyltransferase family 39 protein [Euhalothece natronophila Z-M001]|uniref:Glycosyltransferase family 39 protein n=1 Tax=Euhalothece natronophila Z-M001 TaxID=522448 RepID=A0A5B8NK16_9CHRO|nr:glycosyltransferase family 39 protein [Euhalothece natronophila]QDZ39663.1 glycosyltransferase family 39 protein [Euhalothece natronophila Z-M001]